MSIAYGAKVAEEFLCGAHDSDMASYNNKVESNAAALDAFIGVYERNVLNMQSLAVLPYSEALLRFTAHLEQLDMESNGKSVNINKEYVTKYLETVDKFEKVLTKEMEAFL